MRAGRLETPAELLVLGPDLQPQVLDWMWFGIRAKDSGEAPVAVGLRSPAKVEVRAWWDARLQQGRYLRAEGRLLHLDGVRDVTGQQAELVMTATELVGDQALYQPTSGNASVCRVYLAHGVKRPAENVGISTYSTQLEAALIEVGRPQAGAAFLVDGVTWRVTGLVEDEDDRIVRRMWVKQA
ncbi:hypothetical protein PCLA_13r0038 [Pseudomonas citronellolis]|uniref:hypothetical protein n=1 Tax=Pseudomonas citronellolis TaxID=53408 RepID=UPI000E2E48D8|nr:hypothetical protein [Pseudomonas citronellolis]GBL59192.1 hypothetical protein PCLA_13r0038 [Pseudomonas citronellolis]